MQGVRIRRLGSRIACVFIERNKYAPWGRGVRAITSDRPAPKVLRHGNGRLDDKPGDRQ